MTIDVAELRTVIDNWATTVTRNGVVVKSTVEVDTSDLTELLDAYEERDRLRAALEELVEAHDYWFSTGKGEGRAITATAKAKELLS